MTTIAQVVQSIAGPPPVMPTEVAPPVTPLVQAAGILCVVNDDRVLLLKRSLAGDHAGEWCCPGGKIEGEESPEEAARREFREETGQVPGGKLMLWARRISEGVDFTTFIMRVGSEFMPELDHEHSAYAWCSMSDLPEPLHPGVRVAINKFRMDELGLAKAIAAGELTSPQRYMNVSLFLMRITGTGISYRRKINEFVYRRPEHYLTEEFLERCNGLPVIMMHPDKATLDSKEFSDRIVGTMLLPFIKGDEVWGVAKVYDDEAIALMLNKDMMSTSPAVVLSGPSGNSKLKLEDGSTLLIEGKPSLLDHLAICQRGVWDKGGEPSGVISETRGDSTMTAEEIAAAEAKKKADAEAEEKAKADKAKADAAAADADAGVLLDKCLKGIDSISKRMDAYDEAEKARKDAAMSAEEKEKADAAAKKDADEKAEKEAKEKADADAAEKAKADAELATSTAIGDVQKRITEVAARLPKQLSDTDYVALADAQARADSIFSKLGERAPRPLDGEDLLAYRRRLAAKLKDHSATWKPINVQAIADEATFVIAENAIYADADLAASSPALVPEGQLREHVKIDPASGRRTVEFYGTPGAWMAPFRRQSRQVVHFGGRKGA